MISERSERTMSAGIHIEKKPPHIASLYKKALNPNIKNIYNKNNNYERMACNNLNAVFNNFSENLFVEQFNAYLSIIKNNKLKLSSPIYDNLIKKMADHLKKINSGIDNLSNQNNTIDFKKIAKEKIDSIVFDQLDWENLTPKLKRVLILRHVIAGNVEELKNIISKNDNEVQTYLNKKLFYLGIENNQLNVLELTLDQFYSSNENSVKFASRALEYSIKYGHEEMSIHLVVNKGVKVPKLKYCSEELYKRLKEAEWFSQKRAENAAIADFISSSSEISNKNNENKVNDDCTNNLENCDITEIFNKHIVSIIEKGSVEDIKDFIKQNGTHVIDYFEQDILFLAAKNNRIDMLHFFFDESLSGISLKKNSFYRALMRLVNHSGCEVGIRCLLEERRVAAISRDMFYRALKNYSESILEELFLLTINSKTANPSWNDIYTLAKNKNYFKITELICSANNHLNLDKSTCTDHNEDNFDNTLNVIEISEKERYENEIPTYSIKSPPYESNTDLNDLILSDSYDNRVENGLINHIGSADHSEMSSEHIYQIIRVGSIDNIKKQIEQKGNDIIDYLKKHMISLSVKFNRVDMLKFAFDEVHSGAPTSCIIYKALRASVNQPASSEVLKFLLNTKRLHAVNRKLLYRALKNHPESIVEELFWLTINSRSTKPSWDKIYTLALNKKYLRITKLIGDLILLTNTTESMPADLNEDYFDNIYKINETADIIQTDEENLILTQGSENISNSADINTIIDFDYLFDFLNTHPDLDELFDKLDEFSDNSSGFDSLSTTASGNHSPALLNDFKNQHSSSSISTIVIEDSTLNNNLFKNSL